MSEKDENLVNEEITEDLSAEMPEAGNQKSEAKNQKRW